MIATLPIDEGWRGRLAEMGFTTDSKHDDENLERLKMLILRHGGGGVILRSSESEVENLVSRGELFIEDAPIILRGLHNQCHSNSAMNFLEEGHLIMTGYALSPDGAWREHTWNRDKASGRIIETTEPRIAYFGFELDTAEANEFAEDNRREPDPLYLRGNPDEPFINLVVINDEERMSIKNDDDDWCPVEIRLKWHLPHGPNVVRLWIVEPYRGGFCATMSIDLYEVQLKDDGSTVVPCETFNCFEPELSRITHEGLTAKLNDATNELSVVAIDESSEEYEHLRSIALENYYAD